MPRPTHRSRHPSVCTVERSARRRLARVSASTSARAASRARATAPIATTSAPRGDATSRGAGRSRCAERPRTGGVEDEVDALRHGPRDDDERDVEQAPEDPSDGGQGDADAFDDPLGIGIALAGEREDRAAHRAARAAAVSRPESASDLARLRSPRAPTPPRGTRGPTRRRPPGCRRGRPSRRRRRGRRAAGCPSTTTPAPSRSPASSDT